MSPCKYHYSLLVAVGGMALAASGPGVAGMPNAGSANSEGQVPEDGRGTSISQAA